MKLGHTPGPWHIGKDESEIRGADGTYVVVSGVGGVLYPADSLLIAEAPLMASCLLSLLEGDGSEPFLTLAEHHEVQRVLKIAGVLGRVDR